MNLVKVRLLDGPALEALDHPARIEIDRKRDASPVLRQMFAHPLTDKGLQAFLADWAKTGQSILGEPKKHAAE